MERFDERYLDVARDAIAVPGIASAAIFVRDAGAADLRLAAAAGIDGEPLRRLSVAVLDPAHPIARTLEDGTGSFDVRPTAPGGPALRSHLPVLAGHHGSRACVGVLAVAHDPALDREAREALGALAARAGRIQETGPR